MNPLTSIARTRIIADVLAWLLLGVKLKDLAEAHQRRRNVRERRPAVRRKCHQLVIEITGVSAGRPAYRGCRPDLPVFPPFGLPTVIVGTTSELLIVNALLLVS